MVPRHPQAFQPHHFHPPTDHKPDDHLDRQILLPTTKTMKVKMTILMEMAKMTLPRTTEQTGNHPTFPDSEDDVADEVVDRLTVDRPADLAADLRLEAQPLLPWLRAGAEEPSHRRSTATSTATPCASTSGRRRFGPTSSL